jgi:serine/threonine protein kinase
MVLFLWPPFPERPVAGDASGKASGKFPVEARFFNEARAANLVQHPAIVRVFDYGTTSTGTAYLAMEFLEGESLRARMMRERTLSEAVTIRIGRQIASGLAAAHASQVIHRDLKPENIFVVPDAEAPSGERAKILDFGIANHR